MRNLSDALSTPAGDIELRMEILNEVQDHLKLAQEKARYASSNSHYAEDKYKQMADRDAAIAGLHIGIASALMNFGAQVEALAAELNATKENK